MASTKPKAALYWCSSCGGCEEAVLDLDEKLLSLVQALDIVFWPCAMDFKTADLAGYVDGSLSVALINGAIRTSEQEQMAKMLRKKAQLVVAFGMCAYQGGIPALANLTNKGELLDWAYARCDSMEPAARQAPRESTVDAGHQLSLPRFYDSVLRLDQVIEVDYYLPGCPPTPETIETLMTGLLNRKLPAPGSVIGSTRSLCYSCQRNESKPERLTMNDLKRIHQVADDNSTCFLAQGVLCMGAATRGGCGELCIKGQMPCTGCFGPLDGQDHGARMIAAVGGVAEADTGDAVKTFVDSIPDPAGTFYRYGVAGSLFGGKRKEQ